MRSQLQYLQWQLLHERLSGVRRCAEENRTIIANKNGIRPLVGLLHSRDRRVQEGAARALLNMLAGHDEYTRKVVDMNNGVSAVVALLRSEQLTVRRLGTMLLSMINHHDKGDELIVREGGATLLVKELLNNAAPLPELKAICGLVHHNPSISLVVADAVQEVSLSLSLARALSLSLSDCACVCVCVLGSNSITPSRALWPATHRACCA